MSVDIDWEKVTSGPTGLELAAQIRDFIDSRFQTMALPRFIKSVQVHNFAFGTIPPDVEIKDITDPLPDFYEENSEADDADKEDDIKDDEEVEEAAAAAAPRREEDARFGGGTSGRYGTRDGRSGRGGVGSGMDAGNISEGGARARGRRGRGDEGMVGAGTGGTNVTSPAPGVPGGTSNLHHHFHVPFPHPHHHWSPGATATGQGGRRGFPAVPTSPSRQPQHYASVSSICSTAPIPAVAGPAHSYSESNLASPPAIATMAGAMPGAVPASIPPIAIPKRSRLPGHSRKASHSSVTSGGSLNLAPGPFTHHHHHPPPSKQAPSAAIQAQSQVQQPAVHRILRSKGSVSTFAGGGSPSSAGGSTRLSSAPRDRDFYFSQSPGAGATGAGTSTGPSKLASGGGGLESPSDEGTPITPSTTSSSSDSHQPELHAPAHHPHHHATELASHSLHQDEASEEDDDEAEEGGESGGPREPRVEDTQAVFRIQYAGDVRLALTAELLLDYPMPAFVGIPLKLNITGLSFDGVGVVAKIRRRVHFCFLGPEDALGYVGDDGQDGGDNEDDAQGAGKRSHPVGLGGGVGGGGATGTVGGGLLREVKVESEIGQSGDGGRQTLRNVGKVERFVLEKVRSIFEDELVYPSYWTFLI